MEPFSAFQGTFPWRRQSRDESAFYRAGEGGTSLAAAHGEATECDAAQWDAGRDLGVDDGAERAGGGCDAREVLGRLRTQVHAVEPDAGGTCGRQSTVRIPAGGGRCRKGRAEQGMLLVGSIETHSFIRSGLRESAKNIISAH